MRPAASRDPDLVRARVVLFSGGRGAGVLSTELVRDPRIQLTLAINGYDDGLSTGEVRRFLGDSLGPSDFRKNASRLSRELRAAPVPLIDLLDFRLPDGMAQDEAVHTLRQRSAAFPAVAAAIDAFAQELSASGKSFDFDDCSIGNLVFAGLFLNSGRDFNRALDEYVRLLGLPPGMLENVTDGANAYLVALCTDGVVLATEEEIVGATRPGRVKDIYLIDRPLSEADRAWLASVSESDAASFLEGRRAAIGANPRLAERLAEADLILYAPGTQYSSLFPSYMTPGLARTIAENLHAIKLLVTNIQPDVEIVGRTAVDIIERALYYLQEKGAQHWPTPCLITHYLMNDPGESEASSPYVPLGQVDALEDPRLVRIANYEEGVSGRHDAAKILTPFIRSLLPQRRRQKVAIFFHDVGSPTKLAQSILEMIRGGLTNLPLDLTVVYQGDPLDRAFTGSLPVRVRPLAGAGANTVEAQLRQVLEAERFDYVILFESSGMYRGEDIAGLATHLTSGRLDAVWGSRRLSTRDIEESYRFRFGGTITRGAASFFGSHLLSLSCLVLFGRYVSDTLSAVRAVRAADAMAVGVPFSSRHINQHLLGHLLRRKADILEVPVQFLPLAPDRVKRTTVWDGLKALGVLVRGRLTHARRAGATLETGADLAAERSHGDAGPR
jgi:2-phospho-L-lactate transferase/gluconeogenesis factor (CofD/UPF0052 family)